MKTVYCIIRISWLLTSDIMLISGQNVSEIEERTEDLKKNVSQEAWKGVAVYSKTQIKDTESK